MEPTLQRDRLYAMGKAFGDVWRARRERKQRDTAAEIALIMNAFQNNQYVNPAQTQEVLRKAEKHMTPAQVALLTDSIAFGQGEATKRSDTQAHIEELMYTDREQRTRAGQPQGTSGQQLLRALSQVDADKLRYMPPDMREAYLSQVPRAGTGTGAAADLTAAGGGADDLRAMVGRMTGGVQTADQQVRSGIAERGVAVQEGALANEESLLEAREEALRADAAYKQSYAAYNEARAKGQGQGGMPAPFMMHPTHMAAAQKVMRLSIAEKEKALGKKYPEDLRNKVMASFDAALQVTYNQFLSYPNMTKSEAAQRAAYILLTDQGIYPESLDPDWLSRFAVSQFAVDKEMIGPEFGEENPMAPPSTIEWIHGANQ
jgi:hypothetical protein